MSSPPQATLPELPCPASHDKRGANSSRSPALRFLHGAVFLFLCLFAILLPHSIKGSQHAWQIAFLLWLLTLALERRRPFPQPLSAPLLLYVIFSAISTVLSAEPLFSWDRMKIVCLVLVGITFAQNLHRLREVRTIVYLLILSGVAAAAFTAWQYSYGVGVRVWYNTPGPPIWQAHIFPDDIITRIDGRRMHSPADLESVLSHEPANKMLRVQYLRGAPPHPRETFISREQFMRSGLGTPDLKITRGRPLKAQGTIGHYVNFAEILMEIGCLTWAVLIGLDSQRRILRWLLALAFVGLVCTLFLTETRVALAGMALGGLISILMLTGKRARVWAMAALAVFVL